MTRRLVVAVARVLRGPRREDRPLVRHGSDGPHVCHDPRCASPSVFETPTPRTHPKPREEPTMPKLIAELAAALRRPAAPDTSHVHPGAAGSSAVCNDPQCLARRNTT